MRLLFLRRGVTPAFPEPDALTPDDTGLVALGGEMTPALVIEAYAKGVFPWDGTEPIPWFSPDPRMVLEPSAFHASRSLLRLQRQQRFRVTVDQAFQDVIERCANEKRARQHGTWINGSIMPVYLDLHAQGVAHSVEVWDDRKVMVGGLYGLALGHIFFGESMFSAKPNTSKLALFHLCRMLDAWGFHLLDCQQDTAHLRSLGAYAIPRSEFLERLTCALTAGEAWGGAATEASTRR